MYIVETVQCGIIMYIGNVMYCTRSFVMASVYIYSNNRALAAAQIRPEVDQYGVMLRYK